MNEVFWWWAATIALLLFNALLLWKLLVIMGKLVDREVNTEVRATRQSIPPEPREPS